MKLQTGRKLAAVAGVLVGLAVSLHPSPARALCVDPASCICSYLGVESALIVTVGSVGQGNVEGLVSSVVTRPGETSSFAVGDPVTLEVDGVPDGPPSVGEGLLLANEILDSGDKRLRVLSRIGMDGRITCHYAPDYRPEAADAAQHALSDSCQEDVDKEIGPVECDDTITNFGCSTPGGPLGAGGAGLALGALGLALAAAARRRRRSC